MTGIIQLRCQCAAFGRGLAASMSKAMYGIMGVACSMYLHNMSKFVREIQLKQASDVHSESDMRMDPPCYHSCLLILFFCAACATLASGGAHPIFVQGGVHVLQRWQTRRDGGQLFSEPPVQRDSLRQLPQVPRLGGELHSCGLHRLLQAAEFPERQAVQQPREPGHPRLTVRDKHLHDNQAITRVPSESKALFWTKSEMKPCKAVDRKISLDPG